MSTTKPELKVSKTFSIDIDLLQKLAVYARVHKLSLADALDMALKAGLKDDSRGVKIA